MNDTQQAPKKNTSLFHSGAAQLWDVMYGPVATEEAEFVCAKWEEHAQHIPQNVLDIGCGTGRYVIPLSKKGWDVTGVDSSESMLGVLRQKAKRHQITADVITKDFAEADITKKFDLAMAFFSIIYILPDKEILSFLQKVHRLLNPDGLFIFNFFNAYEFWNAEGWESDMARLFKGGHLKVDYTNKPVDMLRGVAATEDYRQFTHSAHGTAYDLSVRPIRFHSPNTIKLFLKRAGFADITLHAGFTAKKMEDGNTRSPIIAVTATRP